MSEEALRLARSIVATLEEKKAEDILLLDLIGVSSFTDFFVIVTGGSIRTLEALAEEVISRTKVLHSVSTRSVEGDAADGWILLDYGDVIAHLFLPATREYYRLEDLWRSGQVVLHIR